MWQISTHTTLCNALNVLQVCCKLVASYKQVIGGRRNPASFFYVWMWITLLITFVVLWITAS